MSEALHALTERVWLDDSDLGLVQLQCESRY
jgi:hypothetical protein